jgi:hypothetical protein
MSKEHSGKFYGRTVSKCRYLSMMKVITDFIINISMDILGGEK